jgi:hypothetical protein
MRDEHWGWKKHEPHFIKFYNFSPTSSRMARKNNFQYPHSPPQAAGNGAQLG